MSQRHQYQSRILTQSTPLSRARSRYLLYRVKYKIPLCHSPGAHVRSFPDLSFRRYNIHYSEEAEADLPALVPPHHCAPVLLVLLQGHGCWGWLVHDYEL